MAQQANPDHVNFSINVSLMFDNHTILLFDFRISKLSCSRCVICVSCSFHLILTYYARKGSWAFFIVPTNQRGRKIQSHGMQDSANQQCPHKVLSSYDFFRIHNPPACHYPPLSSLLLSNLLQGVFHRHSFGTVSSYELRKQLTFP